MPKALSQHIWIVIPGLNEEKYIGTVLKKVSAYTKNIVVVDDGSTDNMADQARKFTQHVLSHPTNLGKGAALKTGAEYAFNYQGAGAVIFMDSDDQHSPEDLLKFQSALRKAPVVFGIRQFGQNMPLIRIVLSRLASVLIFLLFGSYIPDIPSGYKAFTKSGYEMLQWQAADYAVELEIAARTAKKRANYATVPVQTIYHDMDRGMTILDTIRMVTQIISWRISL